MKGLALEKISQLIIVSIGLMIGVAMISNMLSVNLNLMDTYFSRSQECPTTEGFNTINLREIEQKSVPMIKSGCSEKIRNVTITQTLSTEYLKRLARETELLLNGEPLIQSYGDCSPPRGFKGIATTEPNNSIVAEEGDYVNITWKRESIRICSIE